MRKLFCVYGSLKKGFGNHHYLKDATFLGEFKTLPEYTMYSYGAYPAITLNGKTSIHCEVYSTNSEDVINGVYRLEGFCGHNNPHNFYNNMEIDTPYGRAEIFYVDTPHRTQIIKSGIWQ